MSSVSRHVWARPYVLWALEDVLGRAPFAAEADALQCMTALESFYGAGWRSPPHAPDMVDSLNMGAVQCVKHWNSHNVPPRPGPRPDLSKHPAPSAVKGCCALVVDGHIDPKTGVWVWYVGPYKTYSDPTEAFAHVARLQLAKGALGVNGVAVRDRTYTAVSAKMYGYYRGTKATREENIADHAKAMSYWGAKIHAALGVKPGLDNTPAEPWVCEVPPRGPALPGPPPVISDEETLQAAIDGAVRIALDD